jgi:hypothetical protein
MNEIRQAQENLDALTRRIGAGDPKVTPDALAKAESELRFAEAKQEAEERAELERAETEKKVGEGAPPKARHRV